MHPLSSPPPRRHSKSYPAAVFYQDLQISSVHKPALPEATPYQPVVKREVVFNEANVIVFCARHVLGKDTDLNLQNRYIRLGL